MKIQSPALRLSATDLSNHLSCRHLTVLDLGVARGELAAPPWRAPHLAVIQQLGLRHEADYLRLLQAQRTSVVNLRHINDDAQAVAETLSCMQRGVDIIAQGSLAAGNWFGRPDILAKILSPSSFGNWSYEVYDCKLARETKAATILQLALYSALLADVQSLTPEFMYVVPAGQNFVPEPYRFAEYSAYYRYVKARLEKVCYNGRIEPTYPEPCAHCEICRWFAECTARRRADDHLSFVAGISTLQRNQLVDWQTDTMAQLAVLPVPLKQKPLHGTRDGYVRIREQARVQVQARAEQRPVHEILPVMEAAGFCNLPAPSPLDIFLDLEGDPFAAEGGRQYLFGFVSGDKQQVYGKKWSFTPEEEKHAFEWIVDEIIRRRDADPAMHVYHFAAYEPVKFKWLMGRYTTREDEIDRLLRAGVFVDLHTIFKQAVRAGVEEYSLKTLEPFHNFVRKMPLSESRAAMRVIEHWLELGSGGNLPDEIRSVMEQYNEDDCRSTASLRDWLENQRAQLEKNGTVIPRPAAKDGAPSEKLDERQKRVAALVAQLADNIPIDPAERSPEQSARWLLAQLLDWHRRENKASCWEYYRLADLDDERLLDDRGALAGLTFVRRTPQGRFLPVDTYSFIKQDTDIRAGDKVSCRQLNLGTVESLDFATMTVDIKKTAESLDVHPTSIFVDKRGVNSNVLADSAFRVGTWIKENAITRKGPFQSITDLLLRSAPRLLAGENLKPLPGEEAAETACRVVAALDDSVFAIQGPPGAGKTYTAARVICTLVAAGKKVGVSAFSHKAIRKVLEQVQLAAIDFDMEVRCVQKVSEDSCNEDLHGVATTANNKAPLAALQSGQAQVVAGTVWLWSRPEYQHAVDMLIIDEAGQMALADVVAAAPAAKNLVLIGDPQQLQRPLQGSHPLGAEKSALEHLLGAHKTIPETIGLLLPQTRRMHPSVCAFTSEVFYENKLAAHPVTHPYVLNGHPWLKTPGLYFVPVVHEGNRNSSPEEVEAVKRIFDSLLAPGVVWFWNSTDSRKLELKDILIVAPYNAQVSDLLARLPGANVGTVDKFQGQEAPVVIYSLTTSTPQDAPRGMEFLYSLHRFNVATSRAMSNVIVVGNPRLFEPECRSPRQMQLANAFCRFAEMATVITVPA
jgi:predicted RecB family nuclease